MKLCFPVSKDNGLKSEIYGHFGSAPMFMLVDTETSNVSTIRNRDLHHMHGACNPVMALDGNAVDAVVVGGIGAGALSGLNRSGIRVYQALTANIDENIAMLQNQGLPEITLNECCGGHSHGGGCAH